MYSISKPVNGVTLNGRETLLNEDNTVMLFNTEEEAAAFLAAHGITQEFIDDGDISIDLEEEEENA